MKFQLKNDFFMDYSFFLIKALEYGGKISFHTGTESAGLSNQSII